MNSVVDGEQTNVSSKSAEHVHVQCEAHGCGALLEIEVPVGYCQPSLIVRCGNCSRLLAVPMEGGPSVSVMKSLSSCTSFDIEAGSELVMSDDAQLNEMANSMKALPHDMHLAIPPPLSRAQSRNEQDNPSCGTPDTILLNTVSPTHILLMHASQTQKQKNRSKGGGRKRRGSIFPRAGSQGKEKTRRSKRPTSPYNIFMSQEVKRIKAEHPEVDHREAFKMAASNWARSPISCHRPSIETTDSVRAKQAPYETIDASESNVLSFVDFEACPLFDGETDRDATIDMQRVQKEPATVDSFLRIECESRRK